MATFTKEYKVKITEAQRESLSRAAKVQTVYEMSEGRDVVCTVTEHCHNKGQIVAILTSNGNPFQRIEIGSKGGIKSNQMMVCGEWV